MSNVLYLARVGSHAYGTTTADSDEDFVEVHVEAPEYITGLMQFDTTMSTSEGRTPVGGIDTTVYGLRKWSSLVAQGNPNMIETLFIPNEVSHPGYTTLIAERDAFLSKSSGHRFLGYAQSQQFALMGARNKRTNRPELVHTHGYDTKFGGHLIRVLVEGIELMQTGSITFPLNEAAYIKSIRAGEVDKDDMLEYANDLREILERETKHSDLPAKADRNRINQLLHGVYLHAWGG